MAELSVALIGISGREAIARALDALAAQRNVPPLEVVVAYDPRLPQVETLFSKYPEVRFVSHPDETSPLVLAGRAITQTTGEIVLLTEDHCVADPDWAHALWTALKEEPCGAVGGIIDIRSPHSATDWAFYFVDFYRYARPVKVAASALTVCSAGYRRRDLDAIDVDWGSMFVDTQVHDALHRKSGALHLVERARVTMLRHVKLSAALRERYVFGRVFGSTRLRDASMKERWTYRAGAPLLPGLILRRLIQKALESGELRGELVRSFGPLALMVLAWSLGEGLGYWTAKHPDDLSAARPEE